MLFLARTTALEADLLEAVKMILVTHNELDRLGVPAVDPDTGEALDLARRVRLLGLETAALKQDLLDNQLQQINNIPGDYPGDRLSANPSQS
jgi:hypothetical protein